jgi:hypothetical protein
MHSPGCTQGALQIEAHLCKPFARSQMLRVRTNIGSTLCSHLDAAAACRCVPQLPVSPQVSAAARSCLQIGSSHCDDQTL